MHISIMYEGLDSFDLTQGNYHENIDCFSSDQS